MGMSQKNPERQPARSQCELATNKAKMNIGDSFRAATRPVVTIIFAAVIAQVVTEGIDAPDWFIGLAITVILWWFGDRTVRHIKEKVKERRGEACPLPNEQK